MPGSALLIGGDPGVGKSTLILQALASYAKQGGSAVYIPPGEEAMAQVRLRAARIAIRNEPAAADTWFFLTADYAFGAALERDTTAVVNANGGKVVGGVKHPLNTADFSSFLLQAQASKAKIIGLANAGGDTTNSIKQAAEFGIVAGGQKLAALLLFITDVHSLGLKPRRA